LPRGRRDGDIDRFCDRNILESLQTEGMVMASMKAHAQVVPISKATEVPINLDRLSAVLQGAIAQSLRQVAQETRGSAKPAAVEKPARAPAAAERIQIYEDDPFLEAAAGSMPVPAEPIPADEPTNTQASLQIQIVDAEPDPELYDPSTSEFRYWDLDSGLARAINFWGPLLPGGTQWSTDQQPMQVNLDEGEDFNAFYARETGLNFFHGLVDKVAPPVTVFSCTSPDVFCHEGGHAILDAVKPELFNTMSLEVAAFHEFFGDASAMLSKLQLPSLRDFVLQQTRGHLSSNSRLSQLARQLGWAIRVQIDPTAVDRTACGMPPATSSTGIPLACRQRLRPRSFPRSRTRSLAYFPARSSTCWQPCLRSAQPVPLGPTRTSFRPSRSTQASSSSRACGWLR
jgi:hypothetical protein